ncbi:MAG: hypothetical protein AAB296_00215, partial [Candidatus Desantisbacteria bacterium]
TYNVSFSDATSYLANIQYKITTASSQGGTIKKDWFDIASVSGSPDYTTVWSVDFSACQEAASVNDKNYVSVKAIDRAGNTRTTEDVFYVKKDTQAPAGALSISFSNITTSAMDVTAASLTDAGQGQEFYEFTCSTNPAYSRARTENDNINECAGMTANKQYSFTYQGSDGVINYTSWSGASTKYTLPVAPDVTCNRSIATWYNIDQGPGFIFTNQAGWGDAGVNHLHYVWDSSPTTVPGDGDSSWSTSTLVINATSGIAWYLHLKSHNPEHASNATVVHLGPYKYDGGTPDIVSVRGWTTSAMTQEITNNTWQNYDNTVYYIWTDPSSISDDTFYYTQDGSDPTPATPTYATNPVLDLTGSAKPEGTTYVKVLPRNGAGKSGTIRSFILQYDVTGDNITDLRDNNLNTSDNDVWQNIDNVPYMIWTSPFSGDEAPLAWYKDYFGTDSGGVAVKIDAGNQNNYYNPGITATDGTTYYSKEQARDTAINEGGVSQFIFKYDGTAPVGANLSYGTITTSNIPMTPYGATDASVGMHATPYLIEWDYNSTTFVTADGNSGWMTSTEYSINTIPENTVYAFRVKARDAITRTAPNQSSGTIPTPAYKYTLLDPPLDAELTFGTVAPNSVVVQVTTPPNSTSSLTGAEFDNITGSASGGSDRAMTAGSYSFTDDTLQPNTLYGYKVRYQNGDGVATAWNTTEKTVYTWAAVPSAPTVTLYTDTPLNSELGKVKIVVNENGNPSTTTYAIYDETTNKYLGSDSLLDNAAEEWHTYAEWGGASGIIATGLMDNTTYVFKVKAKNSAESQSAFSSTTSVITPDRTKPASPNLGLIESNCVGWWMFDNSANVGLDSSAFGNNGTNYGATYNANGEINGCMSFDGIDNYVSVPDR